MHDRGGPDSALQHHPALQHHIDMIGDFADNVGVLQAFQGKH
jgi:hypothetical protein